MDFGTQKPQSVCDDAPAQTLDELAQKIHASPRPKRNLFELSDAAAEQIKLLLSKRAKPSAGIKVSVRAKGCSGLSYTLEYADQIGPMDEVVEDKGVKVLIDPKATLFVIGTTMDYLKKDMAEGFVFVNPNEKGRCGCGESFHV